MWTRTIIYAWVSVERVERTSEATAPPQGSEEGS